MPLKGFFGRKIGGMKLLFDSKAGFGRTVDELKIASGHLPGIEKGLRYFHLLEIHRRQGGEGFAVGIKKPLGKGMPARECPVNEVRRANESNRFVPWRDLNFLLEQGLVEQQELDVEHALNPLMRLNLSKKGEELIEKIKQTKKP